jgi:hypothetical protein
MTIAEARAGRIYVYDDDANPDTDADMILPPEEALRLALELIQAAAPLTDNYRSWDQLRHGGESLL